MTPEGSPRQGGGRRIAVLALAVLATLGVALIIYSLATQVGAPPEPALSSGAAASDGGGETASVPSTEASEPEDQPATQEEAQAETTPLPAAEPTALRIPAIDVEEQVFPIGLGEDGELLAPSGDRADQPAWFDGSPTPGEDGPAVIEGHVTWHGDPSVFFELGGLAPGDTVEVDREDGTTAVFEIYDTARYAKDEFPTVAVYGRTDGPEIRIITCGGDLDTEGHHLDNTVVFARLVQN
ncbi:class F sortase [Brachybacterium alimentarium]|uniref:class F sortase n=1 Tax=Brachybacterium alimentarium TaxID=47845 RepID=UPI000DF2595E|nr:class F sortase [Brachybacterium alimentarium]RCS74970.1 sortase [Brachybacterium alimentarium]